MTDPAGTAAERRVLILAPAGRDAALTTDVLARAGIPAHVCSDLPCVCAELDAGAGALLIAEEAAGAEPADGLTEWLARQPPWSDLPVLLLARPGADSAAVARAVEVLGNVTVLERPARIAALVTAARTALRSRDRQYQAREHLAERERDAERLRASEARFRTFADTAPAMLWVTEPDGACSFLSRGWYDFTGQAEGAGLGFGWLDAVHPDDRPAARDAFLTANAGRVAFALEHRLRRADGAYRWVMDAGRPRAGPGGEPLGYIGSVIDITDRKEAEDRSARLAEELRLVTDAVPSLISYVDAGGRYRFVNRAYEEWFGFRREDIRGRHLRDVLGEAAFDRLRPHLAATLAGRRVHTEMEVPYRAGGTRYVLIEYVPDVRPDGGVAGYYGLVTDISDRKRAEEALRASEERRRLALDAAELGAWNIDPATNTLTTDERFQLVFRGAPGPLTYEEAFACIHPDDAPLVRDRVAAATRSDAPEPYTAEYRVVHPGGAVRWVYAKGRASFDAATCRLTSFDGTVVDLTDRRRTEDDLRRAVAELSDADRRKNEFLAMLAHELRNPLAPIRNSLHILKLVGAAGPDTAGVHDMIERQVGHMVRLVDDLLEVSRITRGKIDLRRTPTDLAAVLRTAVETSRPLIDAASHALTVDAPAEPLVVDGDAVRLAQVFANLLNNAAKYTDPGGAIRLRARRCGADAVVTVRDTGAGIPAEMLARVFELFTQIDRSDARAQGGLGIGLTLVKSLVELHGGRVAVRSDGPGMGSEFEVRLPLVEAPGPG